MDGNLGDVVHSEFADVLFFLQCVDVSPEVDASYHALRLKGSLSDDIFLSDLSWCLIEPTHVQRHVLLHLWLFLICFHERVAPADVYLVVQTDGDALWSVSLVEAFTSEVNALYGAFQSRRQYAYTVSRTDDATADASCITTVVREILADGADDILYRIAKEVAHSLVSHGYSLEIVEQGFTLVPGCALALVHHVVAVLGTDGDKHYVLDMQRFRHLSVVLDNFVIHFLREVDKVHLVDGYNNVRDAKER